MYNTQQLSKEEEKQKHWKLAIEEWKQAEYGDFI